MEKAALLEARWGECKRRASEKSGAAPAVLAPELYRLLLGFDQHGITSGQAVRIQLSVMFGGAAPWMVHRH